MTDNKIIAITGATGAQGGGLAKAILNDKNSDFTVRAITRNINSDKAKALTEQGAEVVFANLDDLDSLIKAFDGAYGVYCVTNFWEHLSPEKEMEQALNMAKAAKASGIKHAIWSTLDDTRKFIPLSDNRMPTLMGKYKVPHFDGKGESDHFFTDEGVPVTILQTVLYWENFIYFGMGPKKGPDGKLGITFPMGDKRLSGIAAEDIGKCAYGVFKSGCEYIGKTIGIAGEHLTVYEMAKIFSKILGKEIHYNDVSPDIYRKFGFPGADDLGNMFQFYRDFEESFVRSRSIDISRKLNPELQSFEGWLIKNKDRIPLE
jgi:uncharacterized protein YbjT (DUF2867 family)